MAITATPSSSSLLLPSLNNPKSFSLHTSKPISLSLSSSSKSSAIALSPLFCSYRIKAKISSRFVRNVAMFDQEEEVYSDSEEGSRESSPDLKLYVGNLPFSVDSAQLAELFETAGNVDNCELIYDKISGRSRGFAFVTMASIEEAEAAAQQFNGYELDGRSLRVNSGPPPPRREDSFGSPRESSLRNSRDQSSFRGDREQSSFRGDREQSSFRGGREQSSFRGGREQSSFRGGREQSSFRGGREQSSFRGGREQSSFRSPRGDFGRGGGGGDDANRLYVGNLSWGVDDRALETLFGESGRVVEAKVVYDRESGRSRGFGFVTLSSANEVNKAIDSLNGADLDGRSIRVSVAEAKTQRRSFREDY